MKIFKAGQQLDGEYGGVRQYALKHLCEQTILRNIAGKHPTIFLFYIYIYIVFIYGCTCEAN